jgi:hypothetical protein
LPIGGGNRGLRKVVVSAHTLFQVQIKKRRPWDQMIPQSDILVSRA